MIGRAVRWLRRCWRLRHEGRTVLVDAPNGLRFRWIVDHRYPSAMADGSYETELVAAFFEILRRGDTVFDVGANAGYLSLCAKLAVGQEGEVIAFEPLPENVAMIRRIQEVNSGHPFRVEPFAVAGDRGMAVLEAPRNQANAHLRHARWSETKPTERTLEVPTVALDPYVTVHQPRLIKIDVEGAESLILEAMAGPKAWKVKPTFLVEIHGSDNLRRCSEQFRQWGYECTSLDGKPLAGKVPGQVLVAS